MRVRLGRVRGRRGRALRVGVRPWRELRARVRVIRGLRGASEAWKGPQEIQKSP